MSDQGALFDPAEAANPLQPWQQGVVNKATRAGVFDNPGDLIERFTDRPTPGDSLLASRAASLMPLLQRGAGGAISGAQLARQLGLGSSAEIRRIVKHIRQEGLAPVGSSRAGYFVCVTREEALDTLEHLYQRRNAIDADITGLEAWLSTVETARSA